MPHRVRMQLQRNSKIGRSTLWLGIGLLVWLSPTYWGCRPFPRFYMLFSNSVSIMVISLLYTKFVFHEIPFRTVSINLWTILEYCRVQMLWLNCYNRKPTVKASFLDLLEPVLLGNTYFVMLFRCPGLHKNGLLPLLHPNRRETVGRFHEALFSVLLVFCQYLLS